MKRPFFAAVLVTAGLLAPSAALAGPDPAAVVRTAPAATTRVAPAPDAPVVDRCASRSKKVTTLKRRLHLAKTKRGKARTRRLLSAARRSLKRCRAHKPVPPKAAPLPSSPAPAPAPAPAPPPAPAPAPEPGAPVVTVNGVVGGTFAPTTTLVLSASNLPERTDGAVYHLAVRTPLRPANGAPFPTGCDRRNQTEAPAFSGPSGTATLLADQGWCAGTAKAFVWVAPPGVDYMTIDDDVVTSSFTVSAAASASAAPPAG